jgi:leader peptidase (prepilin peptidase)/N-methyltransferase
MLPVELVFIALFGLALGSFLNVCIIRLPRGESIVQPGSRCPLCLAPIRPGDNIPVLSWVLLRGYSRCCRNPISLRYPAVEALTALLFVACLLGFGLSVNGIGMAVFCWLLLGLAWMDAETYLLPDAFTLPGIGAGVLYQALRSPHAQAWFSALHSMLSAAAVGAILFFVALAYKTLRKRDGMGMGDVKLGAMLGAWLGWELAGVALFLSILAGAIAGIGLSLSRRSSGDKQPLRLPFGSFLAVAGVVTIFAGKPLLGWYLRFFR